MKQTRSESTFVDTLREIINGVGTAANQLLQVVADRVPGSSDLSACRDRLERNTRILADSQAKTTVSAARLNQVCERMEAKHQHNLVQLQSIRAQAKRIRQEIVKNDLPIDEVQRRLLTLESTLRTAESRIDADAVRLMGAREKNRQVAALMEGTHAKLEAQIESDQKVVNKEDSISGRLYRIWNFVSWIIFGFMLLNMISGRRSALGKHQNRP